MKAFGYDHTGDASVFAEYDVDRPVIKDDEVLIAVKAFGLNNFERSMRAGEIKEVSKRLIPGRDLAGVVVETGQEVTGLKVGDLVVARGHHAYSEFANAPAVSTVKLPDQVDFVTAAALVTPGVTAFATVADIAKVNNSQTVVVKGASGGVGSLIVQLADQIGANVIGVGSSRNKAYVESLGVAEYVAYDQVSPESVLKDRADTLINVALEGIGSEHDAAFVKPGGLIVTVDYEAPQPNKDVRQVAVGNINNVNAGKALTSLVKLLAAERLQVRIGHTLPFSLEGVRQGHQLLENSHDGRIVVKK